MDQYGPWRQYLAQHGDQYPPQAQILEIARRLGATPAAINPNRG